MIIVKMGGSVITDKSKYRTFRKDTTDNIIRILKDIKEDIVLVHGGGSFGHIKANEYGIPGPVNDNTRYGFSVIHHDMMHLNYLVASALLDFEIPSVSVPPSSIISGESRNYSIVSDYLEYGITPVTFGDVYLKDRDNFGIYSGDDLVLDLSQILKPRLVVFMTDVDGLYNKNPNLYKDAELLATSDDSARFQNHLIDVTGGIESKYRKMKKISETVGEVYLMNGFKPERIHDIGTGNFIGTVIS